MRDEAQAVVIGGGVGGASIPTTWPGSAGPTSSSSSSTGSPSGSTWHSAGLVGQLRSTISLTQMMMYSVGLYRRAARETGSDPGWHELGGAAAGVDARAAWRRSSARPAGRRRSGSTMELRLAGRGAASCSRRCRPTASLGAALLPADGYLDPSQLTFALADGARRRGAEIEQRRGSPASPCDGRAACTRS